MRNSGPVLRRATGTFVTPHTVPPALAADLTERWRPGGRMLSPAVS